MHLFCENCGKHTSSHSKWVCGRCDYDHNNHHTYFYSFLHKCARCEAEANAYICPHCQSVNLLEANADTRHAARIIGDEKPPVPSMENESTEAKKHLATKLQLQRDIELADLHRRLSRLKLSPEFKKEVSAREKLEHSFSEYETHMMGAQIIAKEQKEKNVEEYGNDPEMLAMKNLAVDTWLNNQLKDG